MVFILDDVAIASLIALAKPFAKPVAQATWDKFVSTVGEEAGGQLAAPVVALIKRLAHDDPDTEDELRAELRANPAQAKVLVRSLASRGKIRTEDLAVEVSRDLVPDDHIVLGYLMSLHSLASTATVRGTAVIIDGGLQGEGFLTAAIPEFGAVKHTMKGQELELWSLTPGRGPAPVSAVASILDDHRPLSLLLHPDEERGHVRFLSMYEPDAERRSKALADTRKAVLRRRLPPDFVSTLLDERREAGVPEDEPFDDSPRTGLWYPIRAVERTAVLLCGRVEPFYTVHSYEDFDRQWHPLLDVDDPVAGIRSVRSGLEAFSSEDLALREAMTALLDIDDRATLAERDPDAGGEDSEGAGGDKPDRKKRRRGRWPWQRGDGDN